MRKMGDNLLPFVRLLSDGALHDGTSIGQQLGITRSAVWKMVDKLQNYGVAITREHGKGYCLTAPLKLLNERQLRQRLKPHGVVVEVFESLPSTNQYALEQKLSANHLPQLYLAEQQTAGRGRLGRSWASPFAQNIYASLSYPFACDISQLAGLSLVVGLAVVHALERFGLRHLALKWPNDVYLGDKKLAGILIAVRSDCQSLCQAVMGMGINVNMQSDKARQINKPWTSLYHQLGRYVDRNDLLELLVPTLLNYLSEFAAKGFAHFIPEWNQLDYLHGKPVTLKAAKHAIAGHAFGVTPQGSLQLQLPDGSIETFSAGDVTVQAIGG